MRRRCSRWGRGCLAVNGRKATWTQLAAGAGIGCVGGVGVLAGYAAVTGASLASTAAEAAGGVIITALTMRDALMRAATHPQLVRVIDQLYRPGAKVGDGGTVDYVRITGDTEHITKALYRARELERLLRRQVLDAKDSELARIIVRELRSIIPK